VPDPAEQRRAAVRRAFRRVGECRTRAERDRADLPTGVNATRHGFAVRLPRARDRRSREPRLSPFRGIDRTCATQGRGLPSTCGQAAPTPLSRSTSSTNRWRLRRRQRIVVVDAVAPAAACRRSRRRGGGRRRRAGAGFGGTACVPALDVCRQAGAHASTVSS